MDLSKTNVLKRPFGIGGTDIAAIVGLSAYKTPLEIWSRLMGISAPETKDMLHLRFGQHAESFIASEYERVTNRKTHVYPETVFHPQHSLMFGHIDRFVGNCGDSPRVIDGQVVAERLLECKTASAFNRNDWGDSGTDQIPASYLMQCAWYQAITQCEYADVAVLLGNNEFRIYHLKRDKELEELLIGHALRFWQDHVLTKIPPKPLTTQDASLLFPQHKSDLKIEADACVLETLSQYRELLSKSAALTQESERLKTQILTYMADAEGLTSCGKTLATWKNTKPSQRIDTKALAAAHPNIASAFTSSVEGARRFLLKEMA